MTIDSIAVRGLTCPTPVAMNAQIVLGHGSGGKLSAALFRERFLPHFDNATLAELGDAAVVGLETGTIAVSTDSFVVKPLEFPGGNIGTLAVHGTLNDLAMMGATPRYLTAGFILEEGLDLDVLDRVVRAMSDSARAAGVHVVAGDTKVVERGKADGLYVNTTGLGVIDPAFRPAPSRARPGDSIIVSGPLGAHGMTIMAAREGIGFESELRSDTAHLSPLVERLRDALGDHVHVLRDPTRGGVASTLNEIASASGVGVLLDEEAIPVPPAVAAACEMLGLDPLYVANEGVLVAFVEAQRAGDAMHALQSHALGMSARIIGVVVADHPGLVAMRTAIGGTRVVDMLPGDQLPRIC
jgi:hydrogenase expression/formation protein HypE